MTASSSKAAEVRFVAVAKQYGVGPVAIENLDLTIRRGEFITLLGPSGSGKTTALNLLAGFQEPTRGQILIDGEDVSRVPAHKRNIGLVFQHYALFPHMTVRENIAYPLKQRRVPKAEMARRIDDVLRMVSLEAFAERMPRQLSGGQQQRVAVARAIVFEPRLLLMDEPLGALDRKLRETVQLELKRIHRELGATIVFVTHDQEEALVMSDRIAVFNAGRIQQVGTAEELYDFPQTQFVAQFLGESNCWAGEIENRSGNITVVSGAGWKVAGSTTAQTPSSGRGAIVVRPERCRVVPHGESPGECNAVPGRLREVVYLGSLRKLVVDLDAGGTAVVTCPPEAAIPSDPAVNVTFPISAARAVPAHTPSA
ncbi:ABC transporter ATP-binding protein [Starkeya sp. ORNL1]|uniref:ABC transporter ATP-binding protein n=1 Tax=Starkeya sp. ORNL1 TaxID=2709380 RepID=UPI0014638130|nr:ABC transporter ATP-binding protein [Starkeya sp. ORNL1]QJP14805.1 ABC transporter ATP-binding protein [Starkeya sp. ORNL1]